ncbi:hypothetical protein Tco_0215604 [Tanacetum coccineum]
MSYQLREESTLVPSDPDQTLDVVFDGAFGGVGDEEFIVGEGVVVISSSLDMLTYSCLRGIMVSLIFLEGLDEETLVEFMLVGILFGKLLVLQCALFLVKLAMSPFLPKKFRMGVAIATGRKGYYKPGTRAWVSRVSRKIRIPIAMYPCRVEERLTIELVEGREVEKIVTTMTKNGVVTRYPGKFHEYQLTDKEKEIERMMIYWEQVEYEVSDDDDSDLKSTARSVPKDYELEDTAIAKYHSQIVTQVTNNVNNENNNNNNRNNKNNGNGGNNGCSYKGFQACGPKEYDRKGGAITLTRWIEKMENVLDNSGCSENQKVKYAASSFVNKALT